MRNFPLFSSLSLDLSSNIHKRLRKLLRKKFHFTDDYVRMYEYFCSHACNILRHFYVEWNNCFIQFITKYGGLQEVSYVNCSHYLRGRRRRQKRLLKIAEKASWDRPTNMDRNHSGTFISTIIPTKYYNRQTFFR